VRTAISEILSFKAASTSVKNEMNKRQVANGGQDESKIPEEGTHARRLIERRELHDRYIHDISAGGAWQMPSPRIAVR
jgi:hypothetical protein